MDKPKDDAEEAARRLLQEVTDARQGDCAPLPIYVRALRAYAAKARLAALREAAGLECAYCAGERSLFNDSPFHDSGANEGWWHAQQDDGPPEGCLSGLIWDLIAEEEKRG